MPDVTFTTGVPGAATEKLRDMGDSSVAPVVAGPKAIKISAVPVVTAALYAVGNEVGGLLTFTNLFGPAGSGVLQGAALRCKSVQTAEFDLYLFDSNPTGTIWTDKTTPAIAAADVPKCIGVVRFIQADSGLGTHTVYSADALAKIMAPGARTIYGVMITKGAPTFTATSDILGVDLIVMPD